MEDQADEAIRCNLDDVKTLLTVLVIAGGGYNLVWAHEDLGVEADRGRDPGGARAEEHLRPRDAPQYKVQLRGGLQEVLGICDRPPQVCPLVLTLDLEPQILLHFDTCSMSSLHIWFSKLKWSLDVLLRFYERHAFICGLHKVKQQRARTINNINIATTHYVRAGDQAAV